MQEKLENDCAEIQTLRSFLQLSYFFSTYCLPNGSFSCIFSSTLTSNFAASLYLSTFLMTFKAMILSLKRQKEIEIDIKMSCKESVNVLQILPILLSFIYGLFSQCVSQNEYNHFVPHSNIDISTSFLLISKNQKENLKIQRRQKMVVLVLGYALSLVCKI